MEFKKIDSYKNIAYRAFPNENRSSTNGKDENWAISYLSAMMHRYVSGSGCELKYKCGHLEQLEKYAKGTQGAKKVKEKLLRLQKDGSFKGRMKDVFQTLDILPEMIDVILAENMKADYKAQSVAVDEMSIDDKDMEVSMAKYLVEEQTKAFLKFMGIKVDSPLTDDEIATFTSADIDVLYQTGGIQLQRELACVSVCNSSMLYSGHKEIENLNSFDIITYGIAATKTYWDYNDNCSKYRHVDVKNLLIPSSKYNDFRDITYAGEVVMMTLGQVISECPDITEDKIRALIDMSSYLNADFGGLHSHLDQYLRRENDIFDEYRVAVLDAQWLSTDIEKTLQYSNSNGGIYYKKIAEDFRIKPSKSKRGQKINRKQYIKRYTAKWVIGSDILLDFSEAKNNAYYGPKGARIPKLDFNIVKTGKKSLVDRCRFIVDDIDLIHAKLRSAIATLPPAPRMIVYDHALRGIKRGGVVQSPRDLFDGLSEDGVMVVNGVDHNGKPINSNGGKAVEFFNTGLAEDIAIFSNEGASKVSMLRQVLGLPEGLDGTAGQKYQLATTMQLAASASSNALFPTTSRIGALYEITFDNCIRNTQAMCKVKDLKVSDIGVSNRVAKIFNLSKDFSNYEFKIKIVFVATEAEKEFLLHQVTEFAALNVTSNGVLGCNKAEFFMLYKLIKAGLIDEAMMRIARIEKIRNDAYIKMQQATMADTAQQQQDSNRIAEEEKRRTAEITEANKRVTELLSKQSEGINDLQKMFLSSYDKENASIPGDIYNSLVDTNKGVVSNIISKDEQLLNPPVPAEQMPIEQMV